MESQSASVQAGLTSLSVPNVSENKGPFWHVKTHKVRTKIHCKMQSFPSLTYIIRTMHVFQTHTPMHIYTDVINLDFSVSCHLPFAKEHSTIRKEK